MHWVPRSYSAVVFCAHVRLRLLGWHHLVWGSTAFLHTISRLPRDVQAEAIPLILGGGDVLMVTLSATQDLKKNTGPFIFPLANTVGLYTPVY